MPAFPKPTFVYDFDVSEQISLLRSYRDNKPGRNIPGKKPTHLLIATWNIANLGLQKRQADHYELLSEIISWFDLIALQEVNDKLEGLNELLKFLPSNYRRVFTDKGGNNERMAFLYDSAKVSLGEKIGELAIPPKDHEHIQLDGVSAEFTGFDRNPFLVSFKASGLDFILVNVHSYFGDESTASIERRALETYAIGRWVDLRRKSRNRYTKRIFALGDFNMPLVDEEDPIYKALTDRGLKLPQYSSKIWSNINDDKQYDQIAFSPGSSQLLTKKPAVFDFDGAVFPDLYQDRTKADFKKYLKYYLSDHRPLWMELKIS